MTPAWDGIPNPKPDVRGRRVQLVVCNDRYTNLGPGLLGTATGYDDAGTLHVAWDNGSRLGLCADDGDAWLWIKEGDDGP